MRRRKRRRLNPWVRKILWSRNWQSTQAFLPGKSHGQRSLAGYSPWVAKSWTWLTEHAANQCSSLIWISLSVFLGEFIPMLLMQLSICLWSSLRGCASSPEWIWLTCWLPGALSTLWVLVCLFLWTALIGDTRGQQFRNKPSIPSWSCSIPYTLSDWRAGGCPSVTKEIWGDWKGTGQEGTLGAAKSQEARVWAGFLCSAPRPACVCYRHACVHSRFIQGLLWLLWFLRVLLNL